MAIGGIVYGDIFVENEQAFIKFFTEYYKNNITNINLITEKLIQNLEEIIWTLNSNDIIEQNRLFNYTINNFEKNYKLFQKEVLLNTKSTSLLVGYRSYSGKTIKYNYSKDINEQMFYDNNQYSIYTDKMKDSITNMQRYRKAITVEYFLQEHYNELLRFLETPISNFQAQLIHAFHSNTINLNKNEHLTGSTWHQSFYGNKYKANYIGTVQDGFLNHVANYETSIFKFLTSQGQMSDSVEDTINTLIKIATSVYKEEGGVVPNGHFAELLHESQNSTSWFKSGDILIVGDKREIIYNIQLKITQYKKPSNFAISFIELRNFLKKIQIENDPQKKAQLLFKNLKTSVSNTIDLNNAPMEDIEQFIKETLTSKAQELLNITIKY